MKVTSGGMGTHSRTGLLRTSVLVALALGIALTLLFAVRPVAADGPYDFLVPIVLEEFRTPPKVVEPPNVNVQRQVQGNDASITQTFPKLPANFDCNAHLGWEHTNGRQWDSADRVWRQVGSYYFTGQYANTGEPICERRFSSAGPGSYADKLGYGLTLCSLAPTWQTIDPETGEAVGGPAEKHYTGHKTSSGQDICSDFDGLRSTKKYIQEQQLKQLCSREPTHALCN